jgi:general secretion pathway protein D
MPRSPTIFMKNCSRYLVLFAASHLLQGIGHTQTEMPARIRGSVSSNTVAPVVQLAPNPALSGTPTTPSGQNIIGFTATPVSEVLAEYFRVTGRRVLRDRGLESAVVTIDVPGEFSEEEYRIIIEKGLLMHGYALVPSGDNLYKLIAAEQGSTPSTQNVPMILRAEDLPKSDQVVTHVLQLNHLRAEEASAAFQQIIPLHPYGKMLAVPNVRALVITEASQTIQAYVELARQVDQPPMETVQKTIRIERAEAEDVVEQLGVLLGLGNAALSTGAGTAGNAAIPAGGSGAAPMNVSLGNSASDAAKPLMQAVTRTNSIVVVARPLDMQKIEALVRELDAESSSSRYFSRKLNYLDLTVFLSIAEKALSRNDPKGKDDSLTAQQGNQQSSSQPSSAFASANSGSALSGGVNSTPNAGGTGYPSSMTGGTGFGQGLGTGNSASNLQVTKKPVSILIANTLVIADPASSKFFASGPPDQIKALQELAEELDVRPRQILLSAIIGEFTLGDDFNFGLDWIQTLKQAGDDGLVGGVLNTQGTAFANPSNLKDIAGFLVANGPASLGGLTAYGQINKNLSIFLQTLERTRRFHVLQKPTVTTLNHQPASIYIGQQVAIAGQTYTNGAVAGGGLGFTSTTQYIPVRLQLDIIPHIYNDSEVMLEFRQQNNDVSGFTTISGNRVPNISEQGMQNSLIVPDRATAMLGGLITERDTNTKSGLPFLVRIPVIKHLFGSTTNNKERREMMIFVQPRILPDSTSHMLEQAKFGDYSTNFDEAAGFAGMPETIVPRAIPAREDQPNDLLPPPVVAPEAAPKKSFFGKVKSIFGRKKAD